jgi:hypothetical protein
MVRRNVIDNKAVEQRPRTWTPKHNTVTRQQYRLFSAPLKKQSTFYPGPHHKKPPIFKVSGTQHLFLFCGEDIFCRHDLRFVSQIYQFDSLLSDKV